MRGVSALIDLHVHTTASDGTSAPAEVVKAAIEAGLTAIAVTDHDSVAGVAPALEAAAGTPLEIVPGVELSASVGERDLHILGYFIDHRDSALSDLLADLRAKRLERARAMVAALAAAGQHVTIEDVLALANGGAVGRAHIARQLVASGSVTSMDEAFANLIGRDGPCYVAKPFLAAPDAMRAITAAGGAPVLAHPGVSNADDVIATLADEGLVGIEAFHGEHDEQTRERYCVIAEYLGLVVTGGSDYHGPRAKGPGIGAVVAPDGALEQLRARARTA